MAAIELDDGFCFGFGGTNARIADCARGDISGYHREDTPDKPEELFKWMSQQALDASDRGARWVVAGFPGPVEVTEGSFMVGPFTNIPGLGEKAYDLREELENADPAIKDILEEGFHLVAVNDGDLAAHAAAVTVGGSNHDRVADIILGTGVGGAVVTRGEDGIYRSSREPFETGHIVVGETPIETFENIYSGKAIEAATGMKPEDIPADHPIWDKVGRGVAKMATLMALMTDAELVVPSGGVGARRFWDYNEAMKRFMEQYEKFGSPAQKAFIPRIVSIPTSHFDTYELYGAAGVMLDMLTRKAAEEPTAA